ncbi:MAG: hypothetical protein WDW38_010872 [Sanguina aurantia]
MMAALENSSDLAPPMDPFKEFVRSQPKFLKELAAGGIAGGVGKSCVAPLERTKILLQTGKVQNTSVFGTVALLYRTEGVRGLFRGNGASVLRIVPYAAIHFSAYEYYRRYLLDTFVTKPTHSVHAAQDPSLDGSSRSSGGSGSSSSSPTPSVESTSQRDSHHAKTLRETLLTGGVTGTSTELLCASANEFSSTDGSSGSSSSSNSRSSHTTALQDPPLRAASSSSPGSHSAASNASQRSGVAAESKGSSGSGSSNASGPTHPVWDLLAGSTAGATAVMCTYPLDLVRTRLAYAMAAPKAPGGGASLLGAAAAVAAPVAPAAGIQSVLLRTFQTEGVVGLYRGVVPTLLGIMPYAGIKFFTYSLLKNKYRETQAASMPGSSQPQALDSPPQRLPIHVMLLCGATSGLLAQSATYPFDMLRRKMQVQGMQAEAGGGVKGVELGLGKMLQSILKEEGVRGLFRGAAYMDVQGSL